MSDLAEPATTSTERTLGREPWNCDSSYDKLGLGWLLVASGWMQAIKALDQERDTARAWDSLIALANARMDFIRTGRLDRSLITRFGDAPPPGLATKPVRLAVLSSSTVGHLLPSLRVGGLRRGIWVSTYEADYGQYLQELTEPDSGLHAFRPTTVLFALDAYHLLRGIDAAASLDQTEAELQQVLARVCECWRLAQERFKAHVIQQTVLPVFPALLGNNEHRLPGSRAHTIMRLNWQLREVADSDGVDLLAVDESVIGDGIGRWHDPLLWHRAKQEVSPVAAPFYGDLVARFIAAKQGRSSKCLVLDLDNTLWGGVIGDDGLEGIVLGQGSALGEAFVALQLYAREMAKRGVILAVCSKNDHANAMAPFEQHPEMILKPADIACFVANWSDKAQNIREIAQRLNIGLDSLAFIDDNPFERNLVRSELPMVAVPEVPEDPGLIPAVIADAGYFEGLSVTEEDRERTKQYQANIAREALQAQAADLPAYLRGLEMELIWKRFDRIGLARTVQLINKTNQFNLTTKRYTEPDVLAIMDDPRVFGLQLRLTDRFGDNGIIAVVIGRAQDDASLVIDTWLMSCRVLGRQVEEATLILVAREPKRLGARKLIGDYRPTAKNGMVRSHYQKLGFTLLEENADGSSRSVLDLRQWQEPDIFIALKEG